MILLLLARRKSLIARVVGTFRSPVRTDSVRRFVLVPRVAMLGFVRVLHLRKPSAAVILGATSSLLVAKILTGSRCKKPCDRAISLQKKLNGL